MSNLLTLRTTIILLLSFIPATLLCDTIDSFNSVSSWYVYAKDGNLTIASSGSGYSGNAMDLSYTFTGSPGKVSAKKDGVFNFLLVETFSFYLKGMNSTNKIYFKVKDADGTKYSITALSNIDNSSWTNIVISKNSMGYDANSSSVGNDGNLSWDDVRTIEFRIEGYTGGTTLIDELSYKTLADKTKKEYSDEAVVSKIKVLYNPYSPEADGNNRITVNLRNRASIKIVVYDINGNIVADINNLDFVHYYSAGDNEFYWDGKDRNGNLLKNGLYVMYLKATSESGKNFTGKVILSILK